MEKIINDGDIRHRKLTWAQLAKLVGLVGEKKVHAHTVRAYMHDLEYHKCIACTKKWLSRDIRIERRIWAKVYLSYKTQDWRLVLFSDEIHFGLGPQGKMRIIRRPGERLCSDCIQEQPEPAPKDRKRLHAFAICGWNFKTRLIWYEINNCNGKMTQKTYCEILRKHVKPLIDAGKRFILEENQDSGHGVADNSNMVRKLKAEIGLRSYFNPSKSPDMSVIESCFQPLKQFLSNDGHWDEEELKRRAEDGWDNHVIQDFINYQVDTMEDRVHALLDGEGKMTGY